MSANRLITFIIGIPAVNFYQNLLIQCCQLFYKYNCQLETIAWRKRIVNYYAVLCDVCDYFCCIEVTLAANNDRLILQYNFSLHSNL